MKVIKEGVDKLPEMEKKAQPVVDVVMADAKEYSDKAEKNFEEVTKPEKFDRKKAFTSGEHQPKPAEAEIELQKISLDESLFEDVELDEMAKPKPRAIEVIERGEDPLTAQPIVKYDAKSDPHVSPQQLALEAILRNPSPIADIYWVSYNPSTGEKETANMYAKRILSLDDLNHDAETRGNWNYQKGKWSRHNMREVIIDGYGDPNFWEDAEDTTNIENALNSGKVVMQYVEEPLNGNWRSFKQPRYGQAISGTLRFGKDAAKNESLELTEEKFEQEKINQTREKFEELDSFNLGYAMNSEEDRQKAIDECNRLLNILNNVTVEDIEISNYFESDEEGANDDLDNQYADENVEEEEQVVEAPEEDVEESLEEAWVTFTYDSGSNPYIAKTQQETKRILDKYKDNVEQVGDKEYRVHDKEEAVDESLDLNEGQEIVAYHDLVKAAPKTLFVQPWKAKEVLEGNYNIINDYIKSGLDAEKYFEKQVDYYGTKYIDWFAAGCPTKYVQNFEESLHESKEKSYDMINYTANAMREQGLSESIKDMRAQALTEDYVIICNKYLDECNELADEFDDEYEITGLPFVTQGLDINEPKLSKQDLEDMYLGKMIRIGAMVNPMSDIDDSEYNGVEGTVDSVDDMGQLHGSWGGLAVIPEVDEFEII